MLKKLAAVAILCLFMASFKSALQGHKTALASTTSRLPEIHDVNSLDSQIAISIIEEVAEDSGNVSFRATKTVIIWHPSGTSACISNIVHRAPNLTRTEYLPSSASARGFRTVISDGKSTWHYEPSLKVVFHMPDVSSHQHKDNDMADGEGFNCTRDLSLIKSNYQVSLVAIENLAGRQAYVIQLEPHYPGNPSRRIWVDREYPFILKTEKYGPDGVMSSVSFYNQIEFFPLLGDDLFQLGTPPDVAKVELPASGDLMPLDELEKEANFPIPVPEFVPPGYVIEGGLLSVYEAFPAAHIRLTDGLNTISYFVLPGIARDSKGQDNVLNISDTSGAKVLRWQEQGYEFTLVGEVDESLLTEMARTVSVAPHISGDPPQQSLSQYFARFLYQLFWFER
jgi:outer membrane lipoprotein-sorting protein